MRVESAGVRALDVPAEPQPHRREHLVGHGGTPSRRESCEQRGGEDVGRHSLGDRGLDGPSAFATVGHVPGETVKPWILGHRLGGEVQQP